MRCDLCGKNDHSGYYEEPCIEKEEQQVINIDYNSQFEKTLTSLNYFMIVALFSLETNIVLQIVTTPFLM